LITTLAMIGVAVAVGLLLGIALLAALLLRVARLALLAFLAALAPVVALDEAAHGLDHAEIVIGVLIIGFGSDSIARGRRLAGHRLVLVEYLVGIAAHAHIRPARVENLVSIGRTIGVVVVMLLVVVTAASAAATIATAARPLTIVWSHYLRPVTRRTGLLINRPLALPGLRHGSCQRDDCPALLARARPPPKGHQKRSRKP